MLLGAGAQGGCSRDRGSGAEGVSAWLQVLYTGNFFHLGCRTEREDGAESRRVPKSLSGAGSRPSAAADAGDTAGWWRL